MVKHNNVLQSAHLRKHWQGRVKCYFNQPAHKKIRAQKRAAKAAALGVTPISKLRPVCFGQTRRHSGRAKFGRGFSLLELKAAGLTQAFARTVGIAVDHRRHNKNADSMATNVERLNQYKNKLILFPKRADKPKKGEINDSTADKLATAAQNTTEGVFALPKQSKRCKIEALTDDMKKAKVYFRLRAERTNRRYHGKREKAAKEAEANKK
jgi:large subunit ribosomal protein L13e